MGESHLFNAWPQIFLGALLFALVFELPLVLADYLTEGMLGLSWSTLAFGVAAFLGYSAVGGVIMKRSRAEDTRA